MDFLYLLAHCIFSAVQLSKNQLANQLILKATIRKRKREMGKYESLIPLRDSSNMAAFEQFVVTEGEEKYQEALHLSTEFSATDPETEPYKSKYKAREILSELKLSAEKHEDQNDERWKFLMCTLDYLLGVNYVDTDELSAGQDHLCKVTEALDSYKLDQRVCNLLQCVYNQLGILWTGRRQNQKVCTQMVFQHEGPALTGHVIEVPMWSLSSLDKCADAKKTKSNTMPRE